MKTGQPAAWPERTPLTESSTTAELGGSAPKL